MAVRGEEQKSTSYLQALKPFLVCLQMTGINLPFVKHRSNSRRTIALIYTLFWLLIHATSNVLIVADLRQKNVNETSLFRTKTSSFNMLITRINGFFLTNGSHLGLVFFLSRHWSQLLHWIRCSERQMGLASQISKKFRYFLTATFVCMIVMVCHFTFHFGTSLDFI